jgi:hypothetical protein
VAVDPASRFLAFPASEEESYVVRGEQAGAFVEISLTRDARRKRRFGSDTYTPVELIAFKRFRPTDMAGYSAYAGNLETAGEIAARGQLGYTIRTNAETGKVQIALIARLLTPDGRVHTEISHEQSFEDPDSDVALVQANERATELTTLAESLNEQWVSLRDDRLQALRAEYDRDDQQAAAAQGLQRIVDEENA